jgi:hypothetical protein
MHGALAVAIILALTVAFCHAQVSLSVFGLSKHSQPGYCEVNPGLGINYQITDDFSVSAARFKMSKCRPSNAIGFGYRPFHIGDFSFGFEFMRLTGYKDKPVYVPIPVGSYAIDKRNYIDFFAASKGDTAATGAAWRYVF